MFDFTIESFDHQPNADIFNIIVDGFKAIRDENVAANKSKMGRRIKNTTHMQTAIDKSKMASKLFRRTGARLDIVVASSIKDNAFVIPPDINKNAVADYPHHAEYKSNADLKKALKEAGNDVSKLVGSIDVEKIKVDGVFSSFEVPIVIAHNLIYSNEYTLEEAAAIFSHELGHLLTSYYYIIHFTRLNHVLQAFSDAYSKANTKDIRVELLGIAKDKLDLDSIAPIDASKIENDTLVVGMLANAHLAQIKSTSGSRIYDARTFEALSDQFAIRIGAGPHLVTALDKLFRKYGGYPSATRNFFAQLAGMLFLIFTGTIVLFVILLYLMADDVYDPPIARLKRMKREVIDSLKNMDRDDPRRKDIEAALNKIDETIGNNRDRFSIIEILEAVFRPPQISRRMDAEALNKLEALANNELFSSANSLYIRSGK